MRTMLCFLTLMGLAVLSVSAQNETETSIPPPGYCSEDISDECPEVDPSDPVILPDPDNCANFCECSNGLAILLTCPPGTLFSEDLGVCDQADDVDCGSRPIGF